MCGFGLVLFGLAIRCGVALAAEEGEAILRIAVDAPGLYEVAGSAVREAGLDLARCDLFGGGTVTPIPIEERPGGSFRFAAGSPSRYSKESVFVLKARPEGSIPCRARAVPRGEVVIYGRHYDPLDTRELSELAPLSSDGREFFFFHARAASSFSVSLDLPRLAGVAPEASIVAALQGDRSAASSNGAEIALNGKWLGLARWAGGKLHLARFALDAAAQRALKERGNTLEVRVRDGRVRLQRVAFEGLALDPTPRPPRRLEPARSEDLTRGGADWLAIALSFLVPELRPLAEHRQKQGLKPRIVRLQDVFDTFSGGNFDPRAIRDFLKYASERWEPKPRFVLLVGDATYDVEFLRPKGETLPTALVDTYDNGASASDNWFVAWGEDGARPELAIGRFPVTTREECRSLVERTIRYETRSEFGPWRRRLSFVAGEGRFGEAVDRAIEELAIKIFCGYVPYAYDLNMTYANPTSPYLYVPECLSDKVVERMNEGSAVLSYTGHGHRSGFDSLRFGGREFPIFSNDDVSRVKCTSRPPIVFITACWTGCFDDPDDEPVGERLVQHETGPAAVFASSRVSHPYANAVLSKELVNALFRRKGEHPRLGEILRDAKRLLAEGKDEYRDMITSYGLLFLGDPLLLLRLQSEEMHLYSLFGDPALVPAFPRGSVTIERPLEAFPGSRIKVRGKAEGVEAGRAIVTFEIARGRIRGTLERPDLGRPGAAKIVASNYRLANDKVVARAEVPVCQGAFEATLALSDDLLPGTHYVKAYAWNDSSDAAGSAEIKVLAGSEEDEEAPEKPEPGKTEERKPL